MSLPALNCVGPHFAALAIAGCRALDAMFGSYQSRILAPVNFSSDRLAMPSCFSASVLAVSSRSSFALRARASRPHIGFASRDFALPLPSHESSCRFRMSDFRLDISKFQVASTDARKQFQGLAHMAELAERHEGA